MKNKKTPPFFPSTDYESIEFCWPCVTFLLQKLTLTPLLSHLLAPLQPHTYCIWPEPSPPLSFIISVYSHQDHVLHPGPSDGPSRITEGSTTMTIETMDEIKLHFIIHRHCFLYLTHPLSLTPKTLQCVVGWNKIKQTGDCANVILENKVKEILTPHSFTFFREFIIKNTSLKSIWIKSLSLTLPIKIL